MKSKTIKKLYSLHSWVGLITGILMFVIAFTGALSVFARPELKIWANADMPDSKQLDLPRIERLVADYASQVPAAFREEVIVFLPGERAFKHLTVLFEAHHGIPEDTSLEQNEHDAEPAQTAEHSEEETRHGPAMGILYEFDALTYQEISRKQGELETLFSSRHTDMADFIADFHADLHLGRPIGLILTGVLGLTLLLSIATGIFIHRKILPQLFTFRPRKSMSLMLNDGHKVIGIWGLLFHATIAFTGAFLGLVFVILVPAAAFISFGGDQEKLVETFVAIPEPVIQHIAKPTQIADILQHARQLDDEVAVSNITIMGYGDASAMAYVSLSGGEAIANQTAVYKGANGEFVERYSNLGRIEGFSGEILDILFPLHFGNFGGVVVKLLWTILGLGTAMLPITGLMLWLERGVKAANPKYSPATYRRFNQLVVGSCGGIVLACVAMFPGQMIIDHFAGIDNVGSVIGWIFFPLWLLATVWALLWPNSKQVAQQLTLLCAFALLSVMPLNAWLTNRHLFNVFSEGHWVSLAVDLSCFAIGAYTLYLLSKWSTPRDTLDSTASINEQQKERMI